MKILVIGSGGREHALVWKLRQSPSVSKVWCAPGNGGICRDAECIAADAADISGLAQVAQKLGADLTVVGPEQPLVAGISDEFAARGLRLFGPSKRCARLEGSKIFAKEFLHRHSIPTAAQYGVYDSPSAAKEALRGVAWPAVLKADGLCGGKGVLVASSFRDAADFIDRVLEKREFGDGGSRLMIEEALCGEEISYIVLTDGEQFAPLVPTRDHKRAFDFDRGPNTGGMGAYSTDEIISAKAEKEILETIVRPTIAGLAHDGYQYLGFLYFGLMLTAAGPKVLEFNCRLGDPETQAIVTRMDFDLAEAFGASVQQRLGSVRVKWKTAASVCVVMASGGYPGKYEKGQEIKGLLDAEAIPDVCIFHAGTELSGGRYFTCGGRILGVTATGPTLDRARQLAYEAVGKISFSGAHYRLDIAGSVCKPAHAAES